LGRAAHWFAGHQTDLSLRDGAAGVGWVIDHLQTKFFPGDDEGDANEELDRILETCAAQGAGDVAGIGVYGLERVRRPSGRRVLEAVVRQLKGAREPRWWPVLAGACA